MALLTMARKADGSFAGLSAAATTKLIRRPFKSRVER